jgi:hypothetical protein
MMLTTVLSVPYLSCMCWPVCCMCSFIKQFLTSPSYFRFKYIFFTICQRLFQQYSSKIVCGNRFYPWRKSEYPGKKRHTARHIDHIKLYRVLFAWLEIKCKALVVIGTDCIGNSTYHAITTTMAQKWFDKQFNMKYLPLFHHFKAINQFPKQFFFKS